MAILWIGSKGLPGEWLGKHLFFLAIHNSIVTLVRANRNKMLARAPFLTPTLTVEQIRARTS